MSTQEIPPLTPDLPVLGINDIRKWLDERFTQGDALIRKKYEAYRIGAADYEDEWQTFESAKANTAVILAIGKLLLGIWGQAPDPEGDQRRVDDEFLDILTAAGWTFTGPLGKDDA